MGILNIVMSYVIFDWIYS